MLRLWRRRKDSASNSGGKGVDGTDRTQNDGGHLPSDRFDNGSQGSGIGSAPDVREKGSLSYRRLSRPSKAAAKWRTARAANHSDSSDEDADIALQDAVEEVPEAQAPIAAPKTAAPASMKGKGIGQLMEELQSPLGSMLPPGQNSLLGTSSAMYNTVSLDSPMVSVMMPSLPPTTVEDATLQDVSANEIAEPTQEKDQQQPSLLGRLSAEKQEKKDPAAECRKVAFDSFPKSAVKWRGLGLTEAAKESKVSVNIMRAAEKTQAKAEQTRKAAMRPGVPHPLSSSSKGKIGTLTVTVIEAKGLPKVDEAGGVEAFVYCRLFATDQTTKPQFEDESAIIRGEDILAKTLKIRWLADFTMDVNAEQSVLEVEVMVADIQARHDSVGRLRLPVKTVMEEKTLDNWFMLKRVDGGLTSATVHVAASYADFVENAKDRQRRRRAELTAAAEEATMDTELPYWISVWDVRAVKEWEADLRDARRKVDELLDEDTVEALKKAEKVIKAFALQGEENSEIVRERLESLRAEMEKQQAVKKKLQELLSGPQSSAVWLIRSLREALREGEDANMTLEFPEVLEALKLLQLAEKHQQGFGGSPMAAR